MTKGRLRRPDVFFGDRFGRLVVIGEGNHITNERGHTTYHAQVACVCGKQFSVALKSLKEGNTRSCGCLNDERRRISPLHITHGMTGTPTYRSWLSMKVRCLDPNAPGFYLWGGRGIKICDRWLKFEGFYADMGIRPRGTSLDRIDNEGDYAPGNCRWADQKTQNSNTRAVVKISLGGSTVPLAEACRLVGCNPSSVREYAEKRGWTYQQAVDHYATNGKSR